MSKNISYIDSYLVSSSINNKSNFGGQLEKKYGMIIILMEKIIPFDDLNHNLKDVKQKSWKYELFETLNIVDEVLGIEDNNK
ncbi:36952_t:CDS:2 [Gigaspora margarita]|uniref:36952_t:CDS:1 n=1 Tax=Gigaspora margarita TaxID=4874 RepID=A0ABN7V9A8_GIGMA|nr:36952_t:CDS:2 [Gigaspora margarita]